MDKTEIARLNFEVGKRYEFDTHAFSYRVTVRSIFLDKENYPVAEFSDVQSKSFDGWKPYFQPTLKLYIHDGCGIFRLKEL